MCQRGHRADLLTGTGSSPGLATLTPGSQDEGSDDYVDLEDAGRLWLTFPVLFLVTLLYSGFVTFLKVGGTAWLGSRRLRAQGL